MTPTAITPDDLRRVEQKLDMIIKHFNIGGTPRRPTHEIERIAREKVLQFRVKENKKRHEREKNQRGEIPD